MQLKDILTNPDRLRALMGPPPPSRPLQTGAWDDLGLLEHGVEDADRCDCNGSAGIDCALEQQTEWVLAAPFRAHLRRLITTTGVPWRTIAVLAEVPAGALQRLLHGHHGRPVNRLHPRIAGSLFMLTTETIADAGSRPQHCREARALLQLLLHRGWTTAELGHRCGLAAADLDAILEQRLHFCSQLTIATIRALTQALWPLATPSEATACPVAA